MKVIYVVLIASLLIACSHSNDKASSRATEVGSLALQMIESQTSDEAEPLEINDIKFKFKENEDEFIDLDV